MKPGFYIAAVFADIDTLLGKYLYEFNITKNCLYCH